MQTQAPAGLRHGIEQLTDWAVAIAETLKKVGEAREDGKVSLGEKLGFVTLVPEVLAAIAGSGEVLAELRDLNPEERNYLAGIFIHRGVTPGGEAEKLKLDAILDILDAVLRAVNLWANLSSPPKALPQPE